MFPDGLDQSVVEDIHVHVHHMHVHVYINTYMYVHHVDGYVDVNVHVHVRYDSGWYESFSKNINTSTLILPLLYPTIRVYVTVHVLVVNVG